MKKIKTLRPWVRYGAGTVIAATFYLTITTWLIKPQPYIVQFDLE